jgi:hypothetical protein
MKQTRHKSVDVAKAYVRDAALWLDNVSALVLSKTMVITSNNHGTEPSNSCRVTA